MWGLVNLIQKSLLNMDKIFGIYTIHILTNQILRTSELVFSLDVKKMIYKQSSYKVYVT